MGTGGIWTDIAELPTHPWLDRSTLRSAWWNLSLLLTPPWFLLNILVFSVSDDIVAPRSGIPVRPLQPADGLEPAEQPDVDVIPAAEDAEPPVEAREDGMEHHEVLG